MDIAGELGEEVTADTAICDGADNFAIWIADSVLLDPGSEKTRWVVETAVVDHFGVKENGSWRCCGLHSC